MIIHHRGLYPDRFDAPYGIGTLIFAKDCHHRCPGCFHADRRGGEIIEQDIDDLFSEILVLNTFTKGIILGGFEWTEQEDEMYALIDKARSHGLEVILYTHYTIEEISKKYSSLLDYKDLYIKCGEYDNTKLSYNYVSYGVPLASTNQKIYKVGVDV